MEDTSKTLTIKIRTLDGKTVTIPVESRWTVKDLKEEFGKWKGAGFERVNLHYRAKRLKDDDLLSKYNIEPGMQNLYPYFIQDA